MVGVTQVWAWKMTLKGVSSECEIMSNSDSIPRCMWMAWSLNQLLKVWKECVQSSHEEKKERPMICTYKLGELLLYGHYN